MTATIYHNPRCSKSRATLALLEENGVTPEIVEYLDTAVQAELSTILDRLGMQLRTDTQEGRTLQGAQSC